MLNLVLADAELELVPDSIAGHPSVRKNAEKRKKRPARTLLDSSLHHHALKALRDGTRRGRPDIAHFFLLLCLDSIANNSGNLKVWVHTRNNEIIHISPETRLPRSASRFFGLMEHVLSDGFVPDDKNPLMWMEDGTLQELLEKIGGRTICLDPGGESRGLGGIFAEEDITMVIGGFAEGDFLSPVRELVDDKICIHGDLLKVWTVVSEILVVFEQKKGLIRID